MDANALRDDGDVVFRLGYAAADDAETPRVEGNDLFVQNDLFAQRVVSPERHSAGKFPINAEIWLETIRPPTSDRYFEDHGLFVRSLYAEYAVGDRLLLQAGKFTPSFAFASVVTPGMYGNIQKMI
ncbi:hypothetical protein [Vacuolonema iberomarrocanum]|uniref:hypothetical protein n=1 Tax=Vacuolonema iberomarrocanum TaxID=3454632 RepID=UPI0019D8E662|nr:hypothetical protein [filamentous cyanobacterium LEGE 07170]